MNLNQTPFNFLSLYSGCGGFDDGFEQNGFKSFGAYDIDEAAIDVYRENLTGPINKVDLLKATRKEIDFAPGEIDVLLSGSPCQGFSTAGKRELNDPRNRLLVKGADIAVRLQPKLFIAENVMGSLSGSHKKYWLQVDRNLRKAGYHTKFIKINCKDFGIAQIRKRVLFIASKKKELVDLEIPTSQEKTLTDVLANVEGLPNHKTYIEIGRRDLEIVRKIKRGQKLSNVRGGERSVHTWDIPEIFGRTTAAERLILEKILELRRRLRIRSTGDADPIKLSDLNKAMGFDTSQEVERLIDHGHLRRINKRIDISQTFNGLYRRLDWAQFSYTVDTRFGNPRFFVHPEFDRGFTVREAARIQGFRDDFIFSGSVANQFRMIGNAVPPILSSQLARVIKEKLNANP